MTPNDVELILGKLRSSNKRQTVLIIASCLMCVVMVYIATYLQEKGKGRATTEDIGVITLNTEISKQKRDLKYRALLNSLNVIDGYFSHYFNEITDLKVKKSQVTTEAARECHNQLILSCDNPEIVTLFIRILMTKDTTRENHPTVLLNQYRNLVREELEFGEDIKLNDSIAWISYIYGDGVVPK